MPPHHASSTIAPPLSVHDNRAFLEFALAEPRPEREWDWYAAGIWLGAIFFSLLAWVGVIVLVLWSAG